MYQRTSSTQQIFLTTAKLCCPDASHTQSYLDPTEPIFCCGQPLGCEMLVQRLVPKVLLIPEIVVLALRQFAPSHCSELMVGHQFKGAQS